MSTDCDLLRGRSLNGVLLSWFTYLKSFILFGVRFLMLLKWLEMSAFLCTLPLITTSSWFQKNIFSNQSVNRDTYAPVVQLNHNTFSALTSNRFKNRLWFETCMMNLCIKGCGGGINSDSMETFNTRCGVLPQGVGKVACLKKMLDLIILAAVMVTMHGRSIWVVSCIVMCRES